MKNLIFPGTEICLVATNINLYVFVMQKIAVFFKIRGIKSFFVWIP